MKKIKVTELEAMQNHELDVLANSLVGKKERQNLLPAKDAGHVQQLLNYAAKQGISFSVLFDPDGNNVFWWSESDINFYGVVAGSDARSQTLAFIMAMLKKKGWLIYD